MEAWRINCQEAKATITLPVIVLPRQDELPVTLRLVNSHGTEFSITLK